MNGSQTLSGIRMIHGVIHEVFIHSDGSEEVRRVVDEGSTITERFAGTETFPNDWTEDPDVETGTHKLTNDEHIRRSHLLEAMMVKYFATSNSTGSFDAKGNSVLRSVINDIAGILGGEWPGKVKKYVK